MRPDEKERLIRLIVQEVMAALSGGASAARSTPAVMASAAPPAVVRQHTAARLITAACVQEWAQQGLKHLLVAPTCLVTPSALDLLQDLGMTLERGTIPSEPAEAVQGQKSVAVVARFLLQMQWQAVFAALQECERNILVIPVPQGARNLEQPLEMIRSRISRNELEAAIVLDDQVHQLYRHLLRDERLMPVMGWRVDSVAGARASARANVLLLNSRSFGRLKLHEMIKTWLSTDRSE